MRSCDERQRGSWVRPCDVARGSEVCGTLEDLIVRVASSPLDTTLHMHIICCVSGARGALCVLAEPRVAAQREYASRSPVRASRTVFVLEHGPRAHAHAMRVTEGRPDTGIRCSVCPCDVCGRYREWDVGTCGR